MQEQITQLEQEIQYLKNIVSLLIKSDKYQFSKHINIADGANISVSSGTGTKIGTTTSGKLAFYGATPLAQQTGVAVTAVGIHAALVNLGLITA